MQDLPDPEWLATLPTLCVGQCCSLKIDEGDHRTWLCRVAGGVTIERYDGRQWRKVAGGCGQEDE